MRTMQHKFVEFIPEKIEDNMFYISMEYGTVIHNCCCGCGSEVNTPLSPTSWNLKYNGETISLSPSIGNWSFPCKSHYWIKKSEIVWDRKWSDKEIESCRDEETQEGMNDVVELREPVGKQTLWGRVFSWFDQSTLREK